MKRLKKPFIKLAAVLLVYAVLFTVGMTGSNCVTAKAETVQKNTEQKKAKKTGWIKKGKYTYYRMKNGKLCRKKLFEIDGKTYSFNKKGRLQKGIVNFSKNTKAYFDAKDGHFVCYGVNVTVTGTRCGFADAKDAQGRPYTVIPLKYVVDKNEKRLPISKVKKNSKICVWFTDCILDSSPGQFAGVIKVTLLK